MNTKLTACEFEECQLGVKIIFTEQESIESLEGKIGSVAAV